MRVVKIRFAKSIGLGLLLLGLSLVTAAIEVQTDDLVVPLSYESLRDRDSALRISRAITITNTGAGPENITALSLQNLATDFHLSLSPTTLQLAAGASQDITLTGDVPVDLNQGSINMGELKITTVAGDVVKTVTGEVKPMIRISELNIYVNNEKKKSTDRDGETVKDLAPGDNIELRIQLENLFDNDYREGDINGNLKLKLDQSGFKQEISEKQHFQTAAGEELSSKDDELVFTITVPSNVEERDYKMSIELTGDDDNDASYEENWELTLEVQRKNDDIRIDSLTVSPTEVSCAKKVVANVKVTNYGSDRQRNGVLILSSPDLEINQRASFELPPGDSDTNFITKEVELESTKKVPPGTYTISATAYYDLDVFGDKKTTTVQVKDCATETGGTGETTSRSSASTSGNATPASAPSSSTATATSRTTSTASRTSAAADDGTPTAPSGSADKISSSSITKTIEEVYSTDDYIVAAMIVTAVLVIGIAIIFFLLLL